MNLNVDIDGLGRFELDSKVFECKSFPWWYLFPLSSDIKCSTSSIITICACYQQHVLGILQLFFLIPASKLTGHSATGNGHIPLIPNEHSPGTEKAWNLRQAVTLVGPIGNVWSVTRECSPKKTQTHRAFQCFSDTICWQNLKWLWYDDGVLFARIHFMLVLPPAFPSSTLLDYMNDGKILAKIFLQVGTFPEIYFWHQLLKDKCFRRFRPCLSNESGYLTNPLS